MVRQLSSTRVLAAVLGSLIVLIGALQTRAGSSVHVPFSLDAVFAAADSVFASDTPETVDLHDGKSRVPTRWQANFERFAQNDRVQSPLAGSVVFVGSSSIDFWSDLPAQFPRQHVIQRGIAGATMADCTRYVDRLVLPSRPGTLVVYAGDNDLANGIAPERIVADFAELVGRVHRELPATRIIVVSVKPSPSRAALMPRIKRTNALLAEYVRTDRRLDFVDIFPAMLDRDSHVRSELFRPDGLHMTQTGYALWRDAIVTHL